MVVVGGWIEVVVVVGGQGMVGGENWGVFQVTLGRVEWLVVEMTPATIPIIPESQNRVLRPY